MPSRPKGKGKSSSAKSSHPGHGGSRAGRPLWQGAISFGLVTIPVSLHLATRREELKFQLLRKTDLSPVNFKRVAAVDGKEVPWGDIVKGYQYEKGKFVVLKDEDFKRVDLEATDTIDIVDFVDLADINPIYFMRPYYMEPQRGGSNAYALLRDVLANTQKAGIAKVVIRTRQHLAAVKANGPALVLELLHFADELVDSSTLKIPAAEKPPGRREVEMATTLVNQMSDKWDPRRYTDDYGSALMKLIRKKVESGGKTLPDKPQPKRATGNVIDLASVLQQSLEESSGGKRGGAKPKKRGKAA
ncbi:MAG: Ku domainn containing protein [Lacunisphaera sp.]|nr:Ku domainn containing protein [Lacunisphaera sp.]MDB6165601.1 Ku domainn containing protein [Lacunisphaera sp.]